MALIRNIDFVFESFTDAFDACNKMRDFWVTGTIVQEIGPGGGNPMLTLHGERHIIIRYLKEVYCLNLPTELNNLIESIE